MPLLTVLHIDDDDALVRLVARALSAAGCEVRHADTGSEGLRLLRDSRPDVVLLDLGLPDIDGLEVCRRVREDPRTAHVPVIMVTAKGLEVDRVAGLDTGADDYITKPFGVSELQARIRAVVRRASARGRTPRTAWLAPTHTHRRGLAIDLPGRRVTVRGHEVLLRAREFDLLAHFAAAPGRVFRRDELLTAVWGFEHPRDLVTRTVDVHVRRLRAKLGVAGRQIETLKGVGYRYNSDPASAGRPH